VHFVCFPCRNELLGLPGMVKITNCEENLNHNQHSNETDACTVIGSGVSCADTTESNKRLFMSNIYSYNNALFSFCLLVCLVYCLLVLCSSLC
jgi:hypothetical protein